MIHLRARHNSTLEQCLSKVDELRLFCWRIEVYEILGRHYWRLEPHSEYYDTVLELLYYLEPGGCTDRMQQDP